MKKRSFSPALPGAFFAVLCLIAGLWAGWSPAEPPRVLVFSKTAAFRHASIEAGLAAIQKLGREHGFTVDATEDASAFNEKNLKQYRAVVFLNTTGDVLDKRQQNDFERYIQAGGGYVGIHSATDTEYDWPWYGKLAGAWFDNHPMPNNVQHGVFHVLDRDFPGMEGLPDPWERTDEFYSFRQISPDIKVLIDIDESSYEGGTNGDNHPMSWYHDFDGGRAFYTNMGHTDETFSEPLFLQHLLGGLEYAMGSDELDYSKAHTKRVPEENRFTTEVLAQPLGEPMELAVLPDERVLFIERRGAVKLFSPDTKQVKTIATIPVNLYYNPDNGEAAVAEDGLLGLATDPDFERNGWIYLYYSPAGPEPKNVLTRYTLRGDELNLSTRKVLLEVAVQRDQCCHTGGSIAFDAQGNLYVSTGDNTNPHATGYAPIDERPGRSPWDAQKSSANTNDLRGKILRIHPEPDGSYTIPEGNLFPPGTPKARPEIYTMGHRNPYRISVDQRTGFVYWGDVGPDASRDSVNRGPAGHDEFNQARKAGNFGWPYFVGDNKAYFDYDFATHTPGKQFDPAHPVNDSPNNTGLRELPPAQKAFIWYPAGPSAEFPLVGTGGRSAMAGPVFYRSSFESAARPFPDYYDGKLFIFEWMRGWIMAVTMDDDGDLVSMERFLPGRRFSNPVDMAFSQNGDLYILEYGTGWFTENEDARLIRIQYNAGNRKPVVQLAADKEAGATPLRVAFSSAGTTDYDGDALTYEWTITSADGGVLQRMEEAEPSFTFRQPGVYTVELAVADAAGARATAHTQIVAGNEVADVQIDLGGANRSFFFPGQPISYAVHVKDKEDGSLEDGRIAPDEVAVTADYLKEGYDEVKIAQGRRAADASASFAAGRRLVEGGTCLSCHKLNEKSIGPSYAVVAQKYKGDAGAVAHLVTKIREGGSGVWGDVMMPPHPQLSEEEASQIVAYVLSAGQGQHQAPTLPIRGQYAPEASADAGVVVLRAAYRDRGANGLPGTSAEDVLVLRTPNIVVAEGEVSKGINKLKVPQMPVAIVIGEDSGANVRFDGIDLTGISEIVFTGMAPVQYLNSAGGTVEVRLDAPEGQLAGRSEEIVPTAEAGAPSQFRVSLKPTAGKHDLYFVFRNDAAPADQNLFILMTAQFVNGTASASQEGTMQATSDRRSAGLSTRSPIGDLLENEQAVEILEEYVPGLTTNPQLQQALGMSLQDIAPYAPDTFTPEVLQAIDKDLAGL